MKTFEVPFTTLKQYMMTGDGPIIVVETQNDITIYLVVGSYELCSVYLKNDAKAAAVFKQEYLSSPRIVYPTREVKEFKRFTVQQVPDEESVQIEKIIIDDEPVTPLLDEETNQNDQSLMVEESKDTNVVG